MPFIHYCVQQVVRLSNSLKVLCMKHPCRIHDSRSKWGKNGFPDHLGGKISWRCCLAQLYRSHSRHLFCCPHFLAVFSHTTARLWSRSEGHSWSGKPQCTVLYPIMGYMDCPPRSNMTKRKSQIMQQWCDQAEVKRGSSGA